MEISLKFRLKFFKSVFCLALFFFFFPSCEKSTSPLLSGQLRLSAEEVGVTEVWLGVQTEQVSGEFTLKLWRDDTCIFQGFLSGADTTVYDSTLLPAHNYRYRARLERNGHPVLESAPLEITTMDTTSHDFQWEVIEIPSPYASGVLYDVAIVDENNIWAVGEIYSDSAQPWLPYNAVHLSAGQAGWDGSEWELKRINFYLCPNGNSPTPYPIQAVFAFSENDIWFTRGASFVHWDGSQFIHDCSMNMLIDGSIQKIWGTNSQDLYAVGYNGTIVHYDGSRWQKIESGTNLKIFDILGKNNYNTGEHEILVVALNKLEGYEREILGIRNNQAFLLSDKNIPSTLTGIWFLPGRGYWVVGSGMYFKKNIYDTTAWKRLHDGITPYYTNAIRGNEINDIYVVGSYGEFLHFNGVDWQSKINETGFYGDLRSVDVKGNLVCAVGENNHNAIIAMFIKNK